MDTSRLDFIDNYFFENAENDHKFIVLHSLFNCITEEEITTLYFHHARGNTDLKRTIESYILKRTTNEPKRSFAKIGKKLLADHPEKDFKEQQSIRKFLSQFIRTLPEPLIQEYFDLLISSERKWDRHSANNVSDLIWNEDVEGKVLDNFYKYQDEYSFLPLIKNLTPTELGTIAAKFWTKEFPSARLKSQILRKIAQSEFDNYSFLEKHDPTYFLQALTIRKKPITEKLIKQIQRKLTSDNKYFLLWCLSQTGNWKLVTKYLS